MKDIIEYQIWWQLKSGNASFWYNNWAGVGSLYHASGPDHWCDESVKNIHELIENGQWKVDMLRDLLPDELSEHIIENIQPPTLSNIQYKPWWQL